MKKFFLLIALFSSIVCSAQSYINGSVFYYPTPAPDVYVGTGIDVEVGKFYSAGNYFLYGYSAEGTIWSNVLIDNSGNTKTKRMHLGLANLNGVIHYDFPSINVYPYFGMTVSYAMAPAMESYTEVRDISVCPTLGSAFHITDKSALFIQGRYGWFSNKISYLNGEFFQVGLNVTLK